MKYKVGDLKFEYDENAQICQLTTPEGIEQGMNPLEMWGKFVACFDGQARRRIGDALENAGRNRYTAAVKSIQH